MSGLLPLMADIVAKVQNRPVLIFRDNTIRSKTADLCSLNLVREVTHEFIVRR
jgi:hypothetical protein